jgi:D-aminoacyl-tRNA deacylase
MAEKLVHLRIFPDAEGKMNRSVLDVGDSDGAAGILLISNFTVAGECSKGRRPGFDRAMKPPPRGEAKDQFDQLLAAVRDLGVPHGVRVETGEFGADMRVSLVNDGPVTLVVESPRRGTLAG